MRTILFIFLAAVLAQNVTYAEEFHFRSEYTPEQIAAFFASTYTDEITKTPERILEPAYARDAQVRFMMIADYIDLGRDLAFLEKYGLRKVSETSYQIDMQRHPGWIKVQDLTSILHPKLFDDLDKKRLREKGLSDREVAIVDAYIQQSDLPAQIQDQYRLFIIEHGEKLAAQFFAENTDKFSVFKNYRNHIDSQNRDLSTKWLNNLLGQLKPESQRILLSFIFDNIGEAGIFPSSNVDAQIETFFRAMMDGSLQKTMKGAGP